MRAPRARSRSPPPTPPSPPLSSHPCPGPLSLHATRSRRFPSPDRYVGIISGLGNTLGTVASWGGPQLVAFLLQRFGSWDIVLGTVAMSNAFAALNYLLHATVTPIEKE